MTALFITLEGGEGVGKTTQLRLLETALRDRGLDPLVTREPGGTDGAEALRALLLTGTPPFIPLAETLLHFAARADHVTRVIRPALAAGRTVLCDRFTDSTLAYQGFGQGIDRDAIGVLTRLIACPPDLTLILDASEAIARDRLAARGTPPDRYDRLGPGFHARVAAGFRAIAAAEPDRCTLIPADGDAAMVQARVLAALLPRLVP